MNGVMIRIDVIGIVTQQHYIKKRRRWQPPNQRKHTKRRWRSHQLILPYSTTQQHSVTLFVCYQVTQVWNISIKKEIRRRLCMHSVVPSKLMKDAPVLIQSTVQVCHRISSTVTTLKLWFGSNMNIYYWSWHTPQNGHWHMQQNCTSTSRLNVLNRYYGGEHW